FSLISVLCRPTFFPYTSLFRSVADQDPALLAHLGKHADHNVDAFTAWNTAGWTYGVFVQVSDNTILSKPLAVYNITDASSKQVIDRKRTRLNSSHVKISYAVYC